MHGPPPAPAICSPARLWRLLASAEGGRPSWPLSLRCAAAPDTPLHVVALRGAEVEALLDDARPHGGAKADYGRFRMAVLAASLWTPDGRAFSCPAGAGYLQSDEAEALADACFAALAICSPVYRRSPLPQWEAVLRDGARDPSNVLDAISLGACVEHGFAATTPRPDLWFGCPIGSLTDGQMMAYRAAREVLRDLSTASTAPAPPFR